MRASERFVRRVRRLRPGRVPLSVRWWVLACWALTLTFAVVILVPGLTDSITAEGSGVIAEFSAPLAFRVLTLVAVAVLSGAAVVRVLLTERMREPHRGWRRVLREIVTVGVPLFPALALAADRSLPLAVLAAATGVLAVVLAHLPVVAGPEHGSHAGLAAIGLVSAMPWLVVTAYQGTADGSLSSSWLWVALFGLAAAFAAFGSYYGVARAAETRSARLGMLSRSDLHPLLVLGLVVLAILLTVLRLTVARELFPEPDPSLWSPADRSVPSWFVAAAVAALIVLAALRASRHPLRRLGDRGVIAVLAAVGNLQLVVAVAVIGLGMVVAVLTGAVFLPDTAQLVVPWAKFAGVALLGLAMLLPVFRGTAARWIGGVTAVFLAPSTLAGATGSATLAGFATSPVQVLILLLAAATALALANPLRPERLAPPGLIVRLAVVPFVAVHAGWVLPAAWSGLGRIVVVIGIVLALFWLMPPVAADRTRHARTVLTASAAQLLALTVYVLAIPSLFADGALTVLGLLWLSIPVIVALTVDTRAESSAAAAPEPEDASNQ